MNRVSTLIYEKRVLSRKTQQEVADVAECSVAMISAIETFKKDAGLDLLYRIMIALDIDESDMLDAILTDLKDDFKEAREKIKNRIMR